MHNQLPTKRNLLTAKRNLQLAMNGHDLLEKKFKVLLREYLSYNALIQQLRSEIKVALKKAKATLSETNVNDKQLNRIIPQMSFGASLKISFSNIMGVLIPKYHTTNKIKPLHSFTEGSTTLDEAFFIWQDVKILVQELAITQIALNHLSAGIKKAQKRSSALINITIPRYQKTIKQIADRLEEHERNELARTKSRLKSKHTNACAQT